MPGLSMAPAMSTSRWPRIPGVGLGQRLVKVLAEDLFAPVAGRQVAGELQGRRGLRRGRHDPPTTCSRVGDWSSGSSRPRSELPGRGVPNEGCIGRPIFTAWAASITVPTEETRLPTALCRANRACQRPVPCKARSTSPPQP